MLWRRTEDAGIPLLTDPFPLTWSEVLLSQARHFVEDTSGRSLSPSASAFRKSQREVRGDPPLLFRVSLCGRGSRRVGERTDFFIVVYDSTL